MPYKRTKLTAGVYTITSPSGNMYVGSTINFRDRWRRHRIQLETKTHNNKILQSAWNKYGGNLVFKPILVCEPDKILFYEQLCLDGYKPKYNISPTAENTQGYKHTPESLVKMRKAWETRKLGPRNSQGKFVRESFCE